MPTGETRRFCLGPPEFLPPWGGPPRLCFLGIRQRPREERRALGLGGLGGGVGAALFAGRRRGTLQALAREQLIDLSSLGTTLNGRHVPRGYEDHDGAKRENGVETLLPDTARIGLADMVFLDFKKAD